MTKIWVLGPGPGPQAKNCNKNMKRIWKHVTIMWICQITWFSHLFYIIFIFLSHVWRRDPDPAPQNHIFFHITGHMTFIWFSYFCISLGWDPVHSAIFESHPETIGFTKVCALCLVVCPIIRQAQTVVWGVGKFTALVATASGLQKAILDKIIPAWP